VDDLACLGGHGGLSVANEDATSILRSGRIRKLQKLFAVRCQ
jgi:hypothetical protein